jgi:hypothetical protein
MPTSSGKYRLLLAVAAVLCLNWSAAHAQGAPVKYWIPFGPFGFGGATDSAGSPTYGDVPGFDLEQANISGFSIRNFTAPVSSLTGFGWHGSSGAFGNFGALTYDSTQFGYSFKGAGNMPVTVFGGVDSLKFGPDAFNTITSLNPGAGAAAAYGFHAGVEIRPTSNLSLSFSAGYTQPQSSLGDGDNISSSLLPRELGGRR